MKIRLHIWIFVAALLFTLNTFAQVPVISYNTPQVYLAGTTISTLSPTNTGGAVAAVNFGTPVPLTGTTFGGPSGMAVDASGNLYITNYTTNVIRKYNSTGTYLGTFGTGGTFNAPVGIVFDSGGNAYILNTTTTLGSGRLDKYNAAGVFQSSILTGLAHALGLNIDASDNIYVTDRNTSTSANAVYKVNTAGTILLTLPTANLNYPDGVVTDNSGNIYVLNRVGNNVTKYNAAGVYQGVFASGFNGPLAMSVDPAGNLYVGDSGNSSIKIYSLSGTLIRTITGVTDPEGTISDKQGNLYASSYSGNAVYKYPATGGYSISGILPAGLTFSTTTGNITGTATTPTATTSYTITAYNGSGSGSTVLTITVNPNPPTVPTPTALCGAGTVSMTATGSPAGGTYRWYTAATGGTLVATGATYAPTLGATTTFYVDYTVNGTTSTRTAVTATIYPKVSSPIASAYISLPFNGNATDVSGNQNDGIPQNSPILTTDRYGAASSAYNFNGTNQYIQTTKSIVNPQVFTLSLWFNTTTTSGGRLIGFSQFQNGGGSFDRHIYMTNAGELVFGVYSGATNTVSTGTTYNDGNWHHVVGTLSSAGMKLYVDNVLKGSNVVYTSAEPQAGGYWEIGGNNLGGWPNSPASAYFAGKIDDVSIYNTELSAATISTSDNLNLIGNAAPVCPGSPLTLYTHAITGATYSWTDPNGVVLSGTSNITTFPAAVSGTYVLTVTGGPGGCTSTANFVPTLYALPTAPAITSPATVATGTAASFSTTATTGITYSWTTGGTPSATTGNAITISWATAGLKTVTLTATNANGCTASTTKTIIVTQTFNAGNYAFSQPITVAALGNTGTLTNFPMLVYIKEDALKSGVNCANNVQFPNGGTSGYDFAFTQTGSSNELFYQVESFDAATGTLTAWVQVPTVTSAATPLTFYFGSTAPAHNATFAYATWSSDYLAVYHLNETSGTVLDATSNQRSATATSTTSTTSGKITSAYIFDGSSSKIVSAASADATGSFTLSGWTYVTDFNTSTDQKIVTNETSYATGGYKLGFYGTTTTNVKAEVETRASNGTATINRNETGGTAVTTGQWHYVQGVYNGTNFITYYDGAADRSTTTGAAAGTGGPIYIGSDFAAANFFKGNIDEIRVSNIAKSADWIKAEYNNQNNYLTYTTTNTAITATSAAAVSAIGGGIVYTWKTTAASTDPTAAANWTSSSGSVPSVAVLAPPLDGTSTLNIPNTTTGNYPKLTTGSTVTISGLTLGSTATLDLNGATLNVGCNIYNSSGGKITSTNTASGLSWTGAVASQTYTGSVTANTAQLGNMTINNSVGGTITMSGGPVDIYTSLNFTKGNLNIASSTTLTLKSDATATAYVSPIPTASTITGLFSVERYVTGSPTSLARRGYRLMSSPVYAATVSGYNVYDLNFLKNSSIVTGTNGATNGFTTGTSTTANASIYLFREDVVPNNTAFAAGNFKGITQLNKTPSYLFGINSQYTITNTNDSQTYLPVGNGFLFFFRGSNILDNGTQTGTKTTSPFDYPENVTFTQTGTLNRGTIIVKPWASGSTALLYTSTILNNVAPNNVRGYNLVGNPYAAPINWEKFNRNGTNSSIYGGDGTTPINATIWQYNSTSKQYASYQPKATVTTADTTLNTAIPTGAISSDGVVNNLISSGQGFFVIANAANQTLTFRESAKSTTSAPAATVTTLMSTSIPSTGDAIDGFMRLKLIKDDVSTDAVAFVLNNKNDLKYIDTEDALDLGGNGALVSLSAYSADNIALSIDRIPLPKLIQEEVQLSVDATTTGIYSLRIEDLKNLPAIYQVWLMDSYKKDSLDMRAHDTYNFNIDKAIKETFGKQRFKLVIRQNNQLAIRLLDFTGVKVTNGNKLSWTIENEANYTNFTVERSTDGGKTFEVVVGFLSTGKGTYTLVDNNPPKGTAQYRLKQDDINGTISYSKIVTLMYANTNGLTDRLFNIYPNPVNDMVNIAVTDPNEKSEATYTIKITNGSGIVVRTAKAAKANWQDNVGNLYPGTYFVQIINNNTKAIVGNGKFVKL
ncbi:LamG-like jellyroll fold domain-containing protein [Mucilaginibacter lutimaris]|uniref:LamG-like jellyroll fold domain-containing protein n=1 Tax=Mucilaginibacter lutimaris TaxID=931629 RepID=A0ABW2ZHK4_9SPHI